MPHDNYKNDIIDRVKKRSVKTANGCIEFTGNPAHEYGLISITVNGIRKSVPAHRALWMATYECWDLPRTINICHKCDNPRCVNMEHLFSGLPKRSKKHKPHTRQRRFTDEKIREMFFAKAKLKDIAEKFGTTVGYVSKIKNRKAKTLITQ